MPNRPFLLLLLVLSACAASARLDRQLVGTWTMEQVYEYGQDVTAKHNPQNDRWITFQADGTFVSDGTPFGRNTGRWKLDREQSVLYIDSDVDDDDSAWKLTFDKEQMIWTGIGHPRKENTKLVHRRKTD